MQKQDDGGELSRIYKSIKRTEFLSALRSFGSDKSSGEAQTVDLVIYAGQSEAGQYNTYWTGKRLPTAMWAGFPCQGPTFLTHLNGRPKNGGSRKDREITFLMGKCLVYLFYMIRNL